MPGSVAATAFVAVLVGYAGSLAVIIGATQAVNATPQQTASWVAGLCLAIAASTIWLSTRHRMPIMTAWSLPGAALLSGTTDISFTEAVGAFVLAAVLVLVTALLRPLLQLIERIPTQIASAMLAGILLPFVLALITQTGTDPVLLAPLIVIFLILRLYSPVWAVLTVLVAGVVWALVLGRINTDISLEFIDFEFVMPVFNLPVLIGLGVPLYVVTMASQNLPGFAVLKNDRYNPPVASAFATTGVASLAAAFVGGHATNLSAIIAAMCTGPDCHPDRDKRWLCGPAYAFFYLLLAIFGGSIVVLIMSLPPGLVAALAGVAITGPFIHALQSAMSDRQTDFAAGVTFVVTASGVSVFNIGAAFWGLVAGIIVLALNRYRIR